MLCYDVQHVLHGHSLSDYICGKNNYNCERDNRITVVHTSFTVCASEASWTATDIEHRVSYTCSPVLTRITVTCVGSYNLET